MSDWRRDYWAECISDAAESCGAALTTEQIDSIAESVQISHENYGIASGHDVASANLHAAREREKADLKRALRREEAKITCRTCNGTGAITTYGGTMMSTSNCWKCSGAGRHDP